MTVQVVEDKLVNNSLYICDLLLKKYVINALGLILGQKQSVHKLLTMSVYLRHV